MPTPSLSQLKTALSIAEQIENLQAELGSILAGSSTAPHAASAPLAKPGKRKMSAATIAKMRASQQARWKRIDVVSPLDTLLESEKPKSKKSGAMSSEHRAKLAAAAKKRWAAIKAGKAANPFGTKKGRAMVRRKIANAGQPEFRIM